MFYRVVENQTISQQQNIVKWHGNLMPFSAFMYKVFQINLMVPIAQWWKVEFQSESGISISLVKVCLEDI